MFGMDLGEILVIAIIAILFLGPDKLPGAMVEIAKFFKNTKNVINSVKDSFEEELNVKSMKDEALAYKQELLTATDKVKSSTDIKQMAAKLTTLEDDFFIGDDLNKAASNTPQEVTLKKSDALQPTNKVEEDKKNV
jgi:sec-independent protein translocase protein TatB